MVATYVASGTGVKFLRMSGGTDVDNLIQKKKKKRRGQPLVFGRKFGRKYHLRYKMNHGDKN
jgi:hypothetical protein